jgi:hypothetical protein
LPIDDICELNSELFAFNSGPDNGIGDLASLRKQQQIQVEKRVDLDSSSHRPTHLTLNENLKIDSSLSPNFIEQEQSLKEKLKTKDDIEKSHLIECCDSFIKAGINKWNVFHHKAYGIACSLYENNPVTNTTVGDPIADSYAILARKNNSILILGDGVNWGPRSRLASRAAVRASMNFINRNLFFHSSSEIDHQLDKQNLTNKTLTTHDLFKVICRSFDAAQEFILQKRGTMTTLCCSIIVKLKESSSTNNNSLSSTWVVCTLSIGDSTAYVFNRSKGVFELTYGARNLNDDRDMRNVGGALGAVYGSKPDVSNLNYSIMYVKEGDIVFLVSDGKK